MHCIALPVKLFTPPPSLKCLSIFEFLGRFLQRPIHLPNHQQRAQGVWNELHCTPYWHQAGDNFSVRGGWWIGHSTHPARRVSGEGDRHRDSGGGSRRCAWTTKTQTELANRGTSVGSMDGIRSVHLSSGDGFTWNMGRTIGLLTGAASSPPCPCGDCIKTLVYLFCKGNASGGWKLWGTKVCQHTQRPIQDGFRAALLGTFLQERNHSSSPKSLGKKKITRIPADSCRKTQPRREVRITEQSTMVI